MKYGPYKAMEKGDMFRTSDLGLTEVQKDIKTDGQIDGRTNRLITIGRQQSGALIIELVEKK